MASRLFGGAVALALVSSVACTSPDAPPNAPSEPAPRTFPADVGVATQRAPMPFVAAPLGMGFDTLCAEPRATCLAGPEVRSSEAAPEILRRLAHPFSQAEVADLLGASDATLRARWHADGDLAEEVRAFAGDPRSVALLYGVEIRTGTSRLDLASAALAYRSSFFGWTSTPAPGTPEFALYCGDDFVVEHELGAQAFLMFRFWFESDAARATFERLVGVDVPLWELRSRLTAADPELRGSYGSSSRTILHGVGGYATVTIGNGDALVASAYEVDGFLDWVTTDGPEGLMAGAAAAPGVIGYAFEPWTAVTTAASAPRIASAAIEAVRDALGARLEDRLRVRDRLQSLQSLRWTPSRSVSEDVVATDVRFLRNALERCYDLPAPDDEPSVARCTAGASPEGLAAAGYIGTPALSDL